MKFNTEKMKKISRPMTQDERMEIESRNENRDWLALSVKFALVLRNILRTEKITQTELAARMEVSCAQVTKLLSGKENIGLQTIAKVEKALGRSIVTFSNNTTTSEITSERPTFNQVLSFHVLCGHTDSISTISQIPNSFSTLYTGKILV